MSKEKVELAHRVYRSRQALFIDNMIGGIAWGAGSVMGATVVVAVIGLILSQLVRVPLIGSYISDVVEEVEKYQQK
jgi:hypothetical protein